MKNKSYRDQEWLENLLSDIWYNHFIDVEQMNEVRIRYGRRAKRRLGSICLDPTDPEVSIITINSIYQDLEVPEYVVKATIVHELTHYAHGFNSPHGQKHQHPHSGGVIRREFAERNMEDLYLMQRKWLKENWPRIVEKHFGPTKLTYRPRKARRMTVLSPWWFREI